MLRESKMDIKYLQVLVMPNGEIICAGKTIGFTDTPTLGDETKKLGDYLYSKEDVANARE